MADFEALHNRLSERFPKGLRGKTDRLGVLEVEYDPDAVPKAVEVLRDDPELAFDMLVDLVSIDYLGYPGWSRPERFGLAYLFKSLSKGHRLHLKCYLLEDAPEIGTISHLYKNADWLEREAFDQMGIRFVGHPNLKRILNHHEFQGHPLRKDYPITRRQWLSQNQSLMDEMDLRLRQKGYA